MSDGPALVPFAVAKFGVFVVIVDSGDRVFQTSNHDHAALCH